MRDEQTTKQTLKIELLSQWKLEAEFRNMFGLFQLKMLVLNRYVKFGDKKISKFAAADSNNIVFSG